MALWDLDEFTPGNLLAFVRQEPTSPAYKGALWLPDKTTSDLSFEYIKGVKNQTVMAHVMGFDSEAPIASRQAGGARVTGELPPIKRKSRIGEKELIRFLQPRAHSSDVQDAIDSVYLGISDLTKSVLARAEWLRVKALSSKTVVYDEGGVIFEFDFGLDKSLNFDIVTKKDGNGATIAELSGSWANHATSDPVNDIAFINKIAFQKTGRRMAEFVTDSVTIDHMYQSEALRLLARGTNGLPGILTQGEIDSVFTRYNLPVVTSYDVYVGREEEDGSIVEEVILTPGTGFMVPAENIGNTLWGPTAESRNLLGGPLSSFAPGIIGTTFGTDEPPAEWMKVAAVAFPTMPGASSLVQLKLR